MQRIESRGSVFDVGDTLGDYQLVSRLSQGGMATLYLGQRRDAPTDAPPVAIKVIHELYSDDWQFVRMFIDEALISVRIRHPNVVRVEELGEKDDRYYLVMEYVHGCSLAHLLRELGQQGRRMRPEIAVWIAAEVAAGLHAAHEMTGEDGELLNVIHRDVSPQNILLSVDGHAKLLDFGIAKAAGRADRTEAGVIKGKVRYMAPEQARGEALDRRVDVYALAVVLWEMLTMRRFIEGKSELELIKKVRAPDVVPPSERAKGIDPRIDAAVLAGLQTARDRRPPTARAFQALLAGAVRPGTVGPAHVAELLRVFLGDELERSFAKIPAPLAAALGEGSSSGEVRPLPGESEGAARAMSPVERSKVLTLPEQHAMTDEDVPLPPARPEDVTMGRPIAAPPDVRPTVRQASPFDSDEMPDYASVEEEDRTMEAGGEELQQFLKSMRAEARAPQTDPDRPPIPIPGTSRAPARAPAPAPAPAPVPAPVPLPAPAPVPASASAFASTPPPARGPEAQRHVATAPTPREPESPPLLGWVVRVAALTLLAFAIGAGVAMAWVHLR